MPIRLVVTYIGSRTLRASATKMWNFRPPRSLQSLTLSSFRRHLKTHYF